MTLSHVQTVLGPVDPSELGHTQFHEHLLLDASHGAAIPPEDDPITLWNYYRLRREHPPANTRLLDRDVAVTELALYSASGGRTIVDATSRGLGRDPEGLHEIAERSGLNVIMGSGYYTHSFHPPGMEDRDLGELTDETVRDLQEGVAGTGIRAGLIGEVGLFSPMHPGELLALRSAARAQSLTDVALLIHPGHSPEAPYDALRIIESEGGALDRTVMGHIDRTLFSAEAILRLAATGCYLELDLFGQEMSHYPFTAVEHPVYQPNDATRVDYILALAEHGHLDQVIVSTDIYTKTSLRSYGGEGYAYLLESVVPLMHEKGLTAEQVHTITVVNPRRALTGA